eukprot:7244465-Prymnesium_polylepis.1
MGASAELASPQRAHSGGLQLREEWAVQMPLHDPGGRREAGGGEARRGSVLLRLESRGRGKRPPLECSTHRWSAARRASCWCLCRSSDRDDERAPPPAPPRARKPPRDAQGTRGLTKGETARGVTAAAVQRRARVSRGRL